MRGSTDLSSRENAGQRSSTLGNIALLAASLLLVVAMLAAMEGMLRLLNIGEPDSTSRLKYQQIFLPAMVPAVSPDGVARFRTVDPRLPPQTILREKPPEDFRVFVFGGSATAGLGYSPNVTFARHLERMLGDAYPHRPIEVVNLGIVALSSKQVSLLVKDAVANFSPDLVVVYSGNNEFLEIHAEKYARAHATFLSRVLDVVADTNLSRTLNGIMHGESQSPSLADTDLSQEELRATQDQIIQDVQLSKDEVAEVVDQYASNIDAAVKVAKEHAVPTMLVSVASNWEWRGRSDLPEGWAAELTATDGADTDETYAAAIEVLDRKLSGDVSEQDRHELLFKRATAHEMLGNYEAAREDFRTAMNDDPHLRRALDSANERLHRIAETSDVTYLDMVPALAARNEHSIVGFEQFYDYVHFTPKGAIWAATAVFEAIQQLDLLPKPASFDPEDYVREQVSAVDGLENDFLDVHQWLGIGFDPNRVHDRDLWKYDKMLAGLNELIEKEPNNFRARVYLGNALFFKPGREDEAMRAYRSALDIEDNAVVRRNLELLLSEQTQRE